MKKTRTKKAPTPIPARTAPPPPVYPPGSARAKRQELHERERLLREEVRGCPRCNALRDEMHQVVVEAEGLLFQALDEIAASEGRPITRKVTFSAAGNPEEPLGVVSHKTSSDLHVARQVLAGVKEHGTLPWKHVHRKCGLCGKPGHRRTTCPEAHVIQRQKKADAAMRDERVSRSVALKPGQRACSVCRRPGHRAKNCPERGE